MFPSAIHLAATQRHGPSTSCPRSTTWRARCARSSASSSRWSSPAAPTSWTPRRSRWARSSAATPPRSSTASSASNACLPRLGELPLGGTAVGTGLNAPKSFARGVIKLLADKLELPLTEARDHFEAQGARDALVEASGVLRTIAVSLVKIANDLRWMGSGPRTGLGEIRIPDLQPGSSIMPGKVNPVVPEAVCQVVAQVIGNDAAVAFGGAAGNLELNVMLPVIARNLLESIRLLASVSRVFAGRCIAGIEADVEQCRRHALSSPSIGTALNPYIGYEEAAKVIKQSMAEGKTPARGRPRAEADERGRRRPRPRRHGDDPGRHHLATSGRGGGLARRTGRGRGGRGSPGPASRRSPTVAR